ncbi:MAG: hemerythrin domain-containing protein [Sandaracinaceae bacterium]|nr:hemerythrin domain-containing protein [Sandaracinaceae bacterium]MBK7779093.1 hemerythrin domain-containing protein [Sandaracinaceae bacterium]MBK8411603.1 hemerythrin domain-containing protein [Sandaracinaceae bacterium]MBP7680638.1 hemerythrin domain-containing protein [Deltaproteobacteria bacterium]
MPAAEPARSIPRHEWSAHPNYPGNLLLLGSHSNFRTINRQLVVQAESMDHGADLGWLARRHDLWIQAMRSHEAYEEQKLYPYLEARWGVSFLDARTGHEALHEVDVRVRAAFEAHDASEAADALRRHEELLTAHLELEEDLVIPLLLELPRAEFLHFTHSSIRVLLHELANQALPSS